MNNLKLKPHEVHVFKIALDISPTEIEKQTSILSADEIEQANQFHFRIHSLRYIAARSAMRNILSNFISIQASQINFSYNQYGKPYLPDSNLYFNLSHSHNIALFACTEHYTVGIDIEYMRRDYEQGVAKRFFSESENKELLNVPVIEQSSTFFRIWARKEAIIKAVGKGLTLSLASFSVSSKAIAETLVVEGEEYSLFSLPIDNDYQAALANKQRVEKIFFWPYFT